MDDPLIMALIGLLAVVVAPVTEETFFRGFMFSALRKRWGFIVAAVASGLLFALAHTDFGSIIPFTVIGVFLAAIYTYTGSLWVSIASHLLFNFISFLAAAITGGAG
jgi:membrane protease YdiL (CAAX protease family)